MPPDRDEIEARMARLDEVLGELERIPGPTAAMALEAVEGLTTIYGEALARVMRRIAPVSGLAADVAADELVGHLLVLHDLHPSPVDERIERALDEVRPYIRSHGGEVALAEVRDGVAKVRLSGTCQSCSSSTATLELAVRDAVLAAAPELTGVEPVQAAAGPSSTLIPPDALLRKPPATGPVAWTVLAEAGTGGNGRTDQGVEIRVAGRDRLLVLRLDGVPYVYRDGCPACGASLGSAEVQGDTLTCPECGARFDARRAGRAFEREGPSLQPVPVLSRDGELRVALAGAPEAAS